MKATRTAMPQQVAPMLATLLKEVYAHKAYVHEVKWDGYRIIAFLNNGRVTLQSRGGQNYTSKYAPVVKALKKLHHNLVLDGEICVLNSAGHADFDALQWVGRSGGGFKDQEMPGILKKLQALETSQSPFVNKVPDTKGAAIHWVKPKLVANFEFAGFTKSGRIRKPATWLGFRNDKNARDAVVETRMDSKKIDRRLKQY